MSLRMLLDDLIHEHGADVVAKALTFLPKIIAAIKSKRSHEVDQMLADLHSKADRLAEEARARSREDETRPMTLDPDRNGAGHE